MGWQHVAPRLLRAAAAALLAGATATAGLPAAQASGAAPVPAHAVGLPAATPAEDRAAAYVRGVYRDVFGRAPDAAGLSGWVAALVAGTPRVAVANGITYSDEYRSGLIAGAYDWYLEREADAEGLRSWLAAMRAGLTISQIEAGFIASDEYFARAGGTPDAWVQALYVDVLDREAAPAEVSAWTRALTHGAARDRVAMGFLLSTEHLSTVVDGYYQDLLGRGLDPTGQRAWVDVLQAGGRDEAIIGGIVASDEYWAREIYRPVGGPGLSGWGGTSGSVLGAADQAWVPEPRSISVGTRWSDVAGGAEHVAAVAEDGTLWTWGTNHDGQLGSGDLMVSETPRQVGTGTLWRSVSANGTNTFGIQADGSLWGWGTNRDGLVGDGSGVAALTPVRIGGPGPWAQVSAGTHHVVALRTDGSLWAWGGNQWGQLGTGSTSASPAPVPVRVGTETDWVQAVASGGYTLALKGDGTLWAWGRDWDGVTLGLGGGVERDVPTPVQVGARSDWASVSSRGNHALALTRRGGLWAWGDNAFGQLGDGTTTDRSAPVPIGSARDWVAIDAGWGHSLALTSDSSLWAWGDNSYHQVSPAPGPVTSPTLFDDRGGWVQVTTTLQSSFAVRH